MNKLNNSKLTQISKVLRRNMTKEEKHLWYDFLSKLPVTFNRQKVVGNYVVDFYCASRNLVIELDGSQHSTEEGLQEDAKRDAYLKGVGIRVLRYTNVEIHERFDDVCYDILKNIDLECLM